MTKKNKSPKMRNWLTYFRSYDGVINPTITDRQNVINLIELSGILPTSTGKIRKIKEVQIWCQLQARMIFSGYLAIVSSKGTLSTTIDLTPYTLHELIDAAIDDDFGCERLTDSFQSKVSARDEDDNSFLQSFFLKAKLKPHLVKIINEYTNGDTGKLMYIACVVNVQGTATVTYNSTIDIKFVEEQQPLNIS